ncbi:MAG: hypothetical protein KAS72_08600 [Phycisphaerales bacterium]|nr:hypothetical protein [Phycisphaerales bacterium]
MAYPQEHPGSDRAASARGVAHSWVASQCKRFPDLTLRPMATDWLDRREADLAMAIEREVARRWLTLRRLVDVKLDRPFDELHPKVRSALLVGSAQLVFLERVAPHAAIHESVEWVKRSLGRGSSGLVNAVLRRVSDMVDGRVAEYDPGARDALPLSAGGAVALREAVLPRAPTARLAVVTSHPPTAVRAMLSRMSERELRSLCLHSLVHPPIILNTTHASGFSCERAAPHRAPGHHVYEGDRTALSALLDAHRDVWVQDPASSAVIELVRDLEPATIMDVCAGQGTKTRQLACTFPDARIIATDVDARRRAILRRAVAGQVQVTVVEPDRLASYAGQADLVLLDVPCSNSGVLARRVEARYRLGGAALESLRDLQRQIMGDSIRLLAPDGMILYATCSLEEEENRLQVDWLAHWHRKHVLRTHRVEPTGLPGEPATAYTDGSFAALIG